MQQNDLQPQVVMPFEEEKSNFDIMEWVLRIIRHWYLFLIAGVIAFSLAYLKNKSVIEKYLTTGTMIIQESTSGSYGAQSLMHGFGVEAGYKNVNNQLIIMGSYDLIRRTVDSLPFMNVEYITQGRFKTRNIYHNTPIAVEYSRVEPAAYEHLFKCEVVDGECCMSLPLWKTLTSLILRNMAKNCKHHCLRLPFGLPIC